VGYCEVSDEREEKGMRILAFIIILLVIGYMAYINAKEKTILAQKKKNIFRHDNHEDK
jgi:hypothetical protein